MRLHHPSVCPAFALTMCKLCASVYLLLVSLTVCQGFFLPVFYRKQPQTPAITPPTPINNVGWNNPVPQSSYKDFNGYSAPMTSLHPVQMSHVPQYSYDSQAMASMAYQMQPQFHNVQLVPCLCPLTRDVIEQQSQNMIHNGGNMQTGSVESGKTVGQQNSQKTS